MINAGDLQQLSCEHTELGGKVFEPKSGEDYNMMPGGFKSNDDDGNITSSGKRIDSKSRYPWSLEPTIGANDGDMRHFKLSTGGCLFCSSQRPFQKTC